MKSSFVDGRKLAHLGVAAVFLLFALHLASTAARAAGRPAPDGNPAHLTEDHHASGPSLCFHAIGGTGPVVHCHMVTAAARAIVPEWSPDPRETVSDDGIVAVPPRAASPRLLRSRVLPLGPPAFILFANFRS